MQPRLAKGKYELVSKEAVYYLLDQENGVSTPVTDYEACNTLKFTVGYQRGSGTDAKTHGFKFARMFEMMIQGKLWANSSVREGRIESLLKSWVDFKHVPSYKKTSERTTCYDFINGDPGALRTVALGKPCDLVNSELKYFRFNKKVHDSLEISLLRNFDSTSAAEDWIGSAPVQGSMSEIFGFKLK